MSDFAVEVSDRVFARPDIVERPRGRLRFTRANVELLFEGSAPAHPGVFFLRGWRAEPGGPVRFRLAPAPAGTWPQALFICAKGRVLETPAGTLWVCRRGGWYAGLFPPGTRLELFREFRVVGPGWQPVGGSPAGDADDIKPVAARAMGNLTLYPGSARLEACRLRARGGPAVCTPAATY
ncbi:MAG TPA: hypothetical protein DEQ28_08800 [Clostridiales bacterium]|nr:hypothetical protein [Clostridiales bacterium]